MSGGRRGLISQSHISLLCDFHGNSSSRRPQRADRSTPRSKVVFVVSQSGISFFRRTSHRPDAHARMSSVSTPSSQVLFATLSSIVHRWPFLHALSPYNPGSSFTTPMILALALATRCPSPAKRNLRISISRSTLPVATFVCAARPPRRDAREPEDRMTRLTSARPLSRDLARAHSSQKTGMPSATTPRLARS